MSYYTYSASTGFPYYEVVIYPMARCYVDQDAEYKKYWRRIFKRLGRYLQRLQIILARIDDAEEKRLNMIRWTTKVVNKIWKTIKAFWRWKQRN